MIEAIDHFKEENIEKKTEADKQNESLVSAGSQMH